MKPETPLSNAACAAWESGEGNGPSVPLKFARELELKNARLKEALANLLDTSAVTESDDDFTTIQCVNKHYEAAYDAIKTSNDIEE